jgi:cytoskeletal protein CcmA (bactofilin family)
MGLFSEKKTTSTKEPARIQTRSVSAAVGLSIVGAGMTVRGDLETEGVVKVEGVVDGHVRARTQVLVAKEGMVHGDIETTEAIVGGAVNGAIHATDRVEVQSGASVNGDITTRHIVVAEGGKLNGQIRMENGGRAADERRKEPQPPVRVPSVPEVPPPPAAKVATPPRPAGPAPSP